jgi:sulfate permease, SulP family
MTQAMAYSMIASLPPHYGFYSSIVPSLIYMFLGSSKHVQLGVNAPISLMVAVSIHASGAVTEEERINAALTITTLGGFAYFAMIVLRLDLVSTFIPDPVMSGFCTAMAFQIMSTNLKYAVGVNLNTVGANSPSSTILLSPHPSKKFLSCLLFRRCC